MHFLSPNQQRQSTEGKKIIHQFKKKTADCKLLTNTSSTKSAKIQPL